MKHALLSGLLAAAVCACLLASAQEIRWNDTAPANAHTQRVTLQSETLSVNAGRPDWVELQFHVATGFHINSHDPHDELLIPTALKTDPSPEVRILADEYPAGVPLRLGTGPGETLSTYQGDFRIRLHVLARKGDSVLIGTLHYQACDAASCFPPRDLPVRIALNAR